MLYLAEEQETTVQHLENKTYFKSKPEYAHCFVNPVVEGNKDLLKNHTRFFEMHTICSKATIRIMPWQTINIFIIFEKLLINADSP